MNSIPWSCALAIGLSSGLIIGVVFTLSTICCIRLQKGCAHIWISRSKSKKQALVSASVNGSNGSTVLSESTPDVETPRPSELNSMPLWLDGLRRNIVPTSALLNYSYKDLEKATLNFTTALGQGSFGPVYRAMIPTGESSCN